VTIDSVTSLRAMYMSGRPDGASSLCSSRSSAVLRLRVQNRSSLLVSRIVIIGLDMGVNTRGPGDSLQYLADGDPYVIGHPIM